jgi:hypothetical protein
MSGAAAAQPADTLALVFLWLRRLAQSWAGAGGVHALWMAITGAAVRTGVARHQNATAAGIADGAPAAAKRRTPSSTHVIGSAALLTVRPLSRTGRR